MSSFYKNILIGLLIFGVLVIAFTLCCTITQKFVRWYKSIREPFTSITVGSNAYKVHEDLENPTLAAETMAKLNQTAKKLINHLNETYIDNPTGLNAIKPKYRAIVHEGIKSLTKNFVTANMEENIPERSNGDTSYVIDKGDVFAMCLRDPHNNNKVEGNNKFNALVFVLIHEMSHLFTSTYGHDDLFWANFRFLLQEAIKDGLYIGIDYKKDRSPYCGIVISYSPLYDPKFSDNYRV